MYTRFFGLTRLPFEASPDPGFLFDSPAHREAIASIEYAVATRMGFIMLTGEVGLGKTTVIRAFLNRYDRGRLLPIYVFHPLVTFDELLELVSDELGLTLDAAIGSFNRLRAIQRELIRLYADNRQVVLVIDEAQRLPEDTLENLRLLTNLETDDAKLLQIVLVGQPELETVLAQPHLRQLEQRIMLKARLESLTRSDSIRYLHHRLTLAGADDPEQIMTAAAFDAVVELADGVPRRMNILANRALIDAFGADEKLVTAARVRRVAQAGLRRTRPPRQRQWAWPMGGLALLALVIAGVMLLQPAGFAADGWAKLWAMIPLPQTAASNPLPPAIATPAASVEPAPAPPPVVYAQAPIVAPAAVVEPPPAPPTVPEPATPPAETAPPPQAKVPALPDATPAPQETIYTVLPGDTLWKICIKVYGPDTAPAMISRVMSRNKIVSDIKLLSGKTIIMPPPKLT